MVKCGIFGYFISLAAAFTVNHLTYLSLVTLANKEGYTNFAESA